MPCLKPVLARLARQQPDVIISDIRMPGVNGLELMQRGYPASCLLLAEVVEPAPSTEHHLVLVVPTERGRFVLDNDLDVVHRGS